MLLFIASMFFSDPAPLEMPRAEGYLVSEGHARRLEDRYVKLDLWLSQAVIGRWVDEEDRMFVLSRLDFEPPSVAESETVTRTEYAEQKTPMPRIRANHAYPKPFLRAIELLSSGSLTDGKPRPTRQLPRGYRDVDYWQNPTNYSEIICAFRREKSDVWYLAWWQLSPEDDYSERVNDFEERFLSEEFADFHKQVEEERRREPSRKASRADELKKERDLLREDVRHGVAAYPVWHFTDSESVSVVDDLADRAFVASLTNELFQMRAKYAAALPTSLDGSNVLSVVRLYATRAEYLEALTIDDRTNMLWSAAYWSTERREIVAHLPTGGEADLLRTLRHEAFHQYLAYAASLLPTSPWLNEGYAEYFEDCESMDWGGGIDTSDENIKRMGAMLPGLMNMNYEQFYTGTDLERYLKYRLAWSIAVFLEKGAAKVRFNPFADLKKRYFASLFEGRDMRRATAAALKDDETLKLFVAEWVKFWKDR